MTVRSYFQLGISSSDLVSFRAIQWRKEDQLAGELRLDLMGNMCGVRGEQFIREQLTVKFRRLDAVGDFGNMEDFRALILHKGPLVYVDFDEVEHPEVFVQPGNIPHEPISTILSGDGAWMLTPLALAYVEEQYP